MKKDLWKQSRRDFLVRTTCAGLSAAAAQASLTKLGLMNLYAKPSAPTDYRALVCVFLDGGNDSNNMVVPTDSYYTNQYAVARPVNSGLQIPVGNLVGLNAPASLGGRTFGLHPSLPETGRALQPEQGRDHLERRPARRPRQPGRTSTTCRRRTRSSLTPTRSTAGRPAARTSASRPAGAAARPTRPSTATAAPGFPTMTTIAGAIDLLRRRRTAAARDRHGRSRPGPRPERLQRIAAGRRPQELDGLSPARSTGPRR